jgi:hypothetical protein
MDGAAAVAVADDYITDLRDTVERTAAHLLGVPAEAAARRPAPGKWSAKEVVGHLIDSASHNHQRFVRAQLEDDLVFPGYAQEEWVRTQHYQDAPWPELVTLWRDYNFHVARVMAAVPPAVRHREHRRHNLHQIAWRTVPAESPATLDYFMRDYVGHLKHHLQQIEALVGAAAR